MDIVGIALGGLEAAQQTLETAAKRLSSPDQPADVVDLSTEMVALLNAKQQFAANAQVVRTGAEMQKHSIDLFG